MTSFGTIVTMVNPLHHETTRGSVRLPAQTLVYLTLSNTKKVISNYQFFSFFFFFKTQHLYIVIPETDKRVRLFIQHLRCTIIICPVSQSTKLKQDRFSWPFSSGLHQHLREITGSLAARSVRHFDPHRVCLVLSRYSAAAFLFFLFNFSFEQLHTGSD